MLIHKSIVDEISTDSTDTDTDIYTITIVNTIDLARKKYLGPHFLTFKRVSWWDTDREYPADCWEQSDLVHEYVHVYGGRRGGCRYNASV